MHKRKESFVRRSSTKYYKRNLKLNVINNVTMYTDTITHAYHVTEIGWRIVPTTLFSRYI